MVRFPEPPEDDYPIVYMRDTDRPLPESITPAHTRYAYFKTIARGGRSIIESCKDLHLMRVVARKSLKPEFARNRVDQTRLIREARIAAMLQHPNTVPTYELGRDNKGHCYFTMKLVHGYTFREVLDFRERYDLTRLMDVVIQIAHALEYAHSHGVAHRDIKPENILVGPFGEVLLLDWGLAKVWNPGGLAGCGRSGGGGWPGILTTSRSRRRTSCKARRPTCRRSRFERTRTSTGARMFTAWARSSTKSSPGNRR